MSVSLEHNTGDLVEALRKAPAETMRVLDRFMGRGAMEVARTARDDAAKASSLLTQTILAGRIGLGHHVVVALAGYAGPVEEGREAGGPMPPLQDLIDWIRVRRITPEGPGVKDERDLAFVIGRKIARDGTEAQPFMLPALEKNTSRLDALNRQAVAQACSQVFA